MRSTNATITRDTQNVNQRLRAFAPQLSRALFAMKFTPTALRIAYTLKCTSGRIRVGVLSVRTLRIILSIN